MTFSPKITNIRYSVGNAMLHIEEAHYDVADPKTNTAVHGFHPFMKTPDPPANDEFWSQPSNSET